MSPLPDLLHVEIENDTEGTNPSGEKRMTVPSLSALAILQKVTDTDNIFLLGVDEICRRLHSGFLLHNKEKKVAEHKFWVDQKFNKNCVLVLSKAMVIIWSDDSNRYWDYIGEKVECFEGEMDIPVAKLNAVCWLEVRGKLKTMILSPKTTYEVAFIVKMSGRSGWGNPVSVNLRLPDGSIQERKEKLNDKPKMEWFQIPIGSFVTSPKNVGELSFQLKGTETEVWKGGLLIKGVLLQPQD